MPGYGYGYGVDRAMPLSPAFDPAAAALIARMTGVPAGRDATINALIVALKSAGVWAKLDVLQVYAAHNDAAARLNWKSTSFGATNQGAAFTADRGFAGNGTSTWLDTGYNPTVAAGLYTLNSAHAGIWTGADGPSPIGHGASPQSYIRWSGTTLSGRINDGSSDNFAGGAATGHQVLVRRGATDKRAFLNGAQAGATLTTASTAIPNVNFGVGRWNASANYTDDRIDAFHAGAALSDAEMAALHAALAAYRTAVGA